MDLLTPEIRERLLANGRIRRDWPMEKAEPDFFPVVKLFTPDAGATWLLTEIDSDDEDIAFGLCDLGLGYPELGMVSLSELAAVRGRLGLPVERRPALRGDENADRLCGRCGLRRRHSIVIPLIGAISSRRPVKTCR
jgi:hypothetical protein